MKLPNLMDLVLPQKFIWNDYKIFYENENCLYCIDLPLSVKRINGKRIEILETFTIPTNITKLSDYCFANCEKLTEIIGLENVKEIGIGCFLNCPLLEKEKYPKVKKNVEKYVDQVVKEEQQKQLEEWIGLKCSDIIFDSTIDEWKHNTSIFDERIIGK